MRILERLTRFSLDHPKTTLGVIAAISIVFGLGLLRIERVTSVRTFIGPDHPTVSALEAHIDRFGAGYPVVIAYSCEETGLCESVLGPEALGMAWRVSRRLEASPHIRSARSPATRELLVAGDGGPEVVRLVDASGAIDPALDRYVPAALESPLWEGDVVAHDGRVGAIVVEIESTEAFVQHAIIEHVRQSLAEEEAVGWRFNLLGELVDFEYTTSEVERESGRMLPAMAIVLFVALYALTRSIGLSLAALTSMGVAALWTQGAMGLTGISLNAVTSSTPTLVFAIGILDGVHVITGLARRRWQDEERFLEDRRGLLVEIAGDIGTACMLTSFTTMGAFSAFALSGVAPLTQFGVAASWGILVALILTFSLLPLILERLPVSLFERRDITPMWSAVFESVTTLVERRHRGILIATLVTSCVVGAGVGRARVDIHPTELAGETNLVSVWNRWVSRHLRKSESVEITLRPPADRRLEDPDVLSSLAEVSSWLAKDPERFARPRSVLDLLERADAVSQSAAETRPLWQRPPEQTTALLAWLDASAPDLLRRWIAPSDPHAPAASEGLALRVSAEVENISTRRQAEILSELESFLAGHLPAGWRRSITGSIPVYLVMMTALVRYQLYCFALAMAASFVLMAAFFKSWRYATLAMIPSLIPCLVCIGMLGLWDYGLDPASTMVATIIIGIAVDDSIHFVVQYRRAIAAGRLRRDAIHVALDHVGQPACVSSIVLTIAFFTLTTSSFSTIANFGFLSGVAIFTALLADLYVLPSMLFSRRVSRLLGIAGARGAEA